MVVLFLAQNIEITKYFFKIKTALLKNKIITIFVKLVHMSTFSQSLVEIKKFVGVRL